MNKLYLLLFFSDDWWLWENPQTCSRSLSSLYFISTHSFDWRIISAKGFFAFHPDHCGLETLKFCFKGLDEMAKFHCLCNECSYKNYNLKGCRIYMRRNMIYLFVVSINHPNKISYQKTSDPFLFYFQIELKIETTKKSPWNLLLLIQNKSLS